MISENDRWKNRRAMAWLSLVAGIAFPLVGMVVDDATFAAAVAPFYLFVTGIVMSYIGWATADDKWQKDVK